MSTDDLVLNYAISTFLVIVPQGFCIIARFHCTSRSALSSAIPNFFRSSEFGEIQ